MPIRIPPCSLFAVALTTLGSLMLASFSRAETIRIDIARDTWLSNVDAEKFGSNGGASRLKLKSIQELSIIDFQTGPLRGKKVTKAKLMIKNAADEPIERVTISTITCDWVEGKGSNYQVLDGVSTFSHRIYPKTRWNDSDLTAVCIGHGGSMYASVDAKASKESGWLELEIPPALIEARAAGLSYGLVLMDDTGSTWTRKGEEFKRKMFPNRFIFSRDSNRASALYLLVDIEPWDETTSPTIPEPTKLRLLEPDPVDPRPRATWNVPPNDHDQLLGFLAYVGDTPVDQFLVPALSSHQQGDYVMPLDRILATAPGDQPIELQIRCVARSGKTSPPARLRVQRPTPAPISLTLQPFAFPDQSIQPKIAWEKGLQGNTRRWTVVDPLDTLLPKSQQWIPAQRASYVAANHLWDPKPRRSRSIAHAAGGSVFNWRATRLHSPFNSRGTSSCRHPIVLKTYPMKSSKRFAPNGPVTKRFPTKKNPLQIRSFKLPMATINFVANGKNPLLSLAKAGSSKSTSHSN